MVKLFFLILYLQNIGARGNGPGGNRKQNAAMESQYTTTATTNHAIDSYDRSINEITEDEDSQPPCLNCSLIQQGSAISYGDNRCPQCGRDVGP